MEKKFREYAPNQILLMPPSLSDWVAEDHPVHFFNDMIETFDLSAIYESYQESRGYPPYDPRLTVKILLYALHKGIHSSRKIERALYEDVAFRYLAGNQQPNFWTISEFRRRHKKALGDLLVQTVQMAQKTGLVPMSHTATDGTKIKAHASKHSAMSYGRMQAEEDRLRREIDAELRRMEEVDRAEDRKYGNRRGDELPDSLSTSQKRLEAIQKAKAALEEEAREKARHDQARREKERERNMAQSGKRGKKRGKPARDPSEAVPKLKDQRNFTDPESKIMKDSDKAFIQAYNAQATVDADNQIIVASDVTNHANDKQQLLAQIDQVKTNTGRNPGWVLADGGYYCEDAIAALQGRQLKVLIPPEKVKHSEWRTTHLVNEPCPDAADLRERLRYALRTEEGQATYKLRQQSVEPVFGYIKEQMQLRQFPLRGLDNVRAYWRMVCAVFNMMKLYRAGFKPQMG